MDVGIWRRRGSELSKRPTVEPLWDEVKPKNSKVPSLVGLCCDARELAWRVE